MASIAIDLRERLVLRRSEPWASIAAGGVWLLIGLELAVLAAWLPDTLASWWRADRAGDFQAFYANAQDLRWTGLYSARLPLLLYPFTLFDPVPAYRVFAGLGMLAWLGVAYLAQRGVASWAGRLAVVLGALTLPQMHWALRIGHLTPFLALAALGGFLLLRRHPVAAGLCLAFLSIKPQYALVPGLYLLWTRNGRALAALLLGAGAMEVLAFAVVGFGALDDYLRTVWDWGADARDDRLSIQAWQYAWSGFLRSVGVAANPLVTVDLVLLSLASVVLAWWRGAAGAALPAAAFGMVLVAPYSNFYDWGLLLVGGALLLRARLPWQGVVPAMLVALYGAALASQAGTRYPPEVEPTGGAPASGVYWITPAVFLVIGLLALSAPRAKAQEGQ